jgi:hypothetical protein
MSVSAVTVADEAWDEFCALSPSAWFWHTTAWRDYTLAYRPDLETRSLAFGIEEDGRLLAIVPLTLERPPDESGSAFSFGGGWCWAPALAPDLSPASASGVLRFVLDQVDALAQEHGAERGAFAVSPLVPDLAGTALRWLPAAVRAGYLDASRASQVVDLSEDVDQLLRAMTKGHRAAVGKGRKTMGVDVAVGPGSGEVFEEYQRLHTLAAGRVTRPQHTFDLMQQWVERGDAVLFGATKDGRYAGFAYVLRFGTGAYYASAANDPGAAGEPVGQVLQWEAMTWLRDHGVRAYELGAQPYGTTPQDPASEKELNIARFKRGFGGEAAPLIVGEKYWSPAAFQAVRDRLEAFAVRLEPGPSG